MSAQMYTAIGGIFEYLNADCDYKQWSQYLLKRLKSLGAGRDGADVGCGNGYFTRALIKAGYDVVGIDISESALSTAKQLALAEGVRAEFLCGDITKLRLGGKRSFITAVNDCINYVPPQDLKKTFARVSKNLKKGGIFIFDVSSPEKLKNELGNNTIVKDYDRATLIWCNTLYPDRVEMELTLFTLAEGGLYTRSDEVQTQYIYDEATLTGLLREAGFEVCVEGVLGSADKRARLNFICQARR